MSKYSLWLIPIILLGAAILISAQTPPITITTGETIRISAGQTAEVVVQVGNNTQNPLSDVSIECQLDADPELLSYAEGRMFPRDFSTSVISDDTIRFPESGGIDLIAGQFTNVAVTLQAGSNIAAATDSTITCELFAEGASLGSDSAGINSPAGTAPEPPADISPELQAVATSLQINNGAQIEVTDGEQTEVVVQLGNTGQLTLLEARLICTLGNEVGAVSLVEDAIQARNFESFAIADNSVTFPETGGITIEPGQFYTVGIGVLVEGDESGAVSSAISCDLFADVEQTIVQDIVVEEPAVEEAQPPQPPADAGNGDGLIQINNGPQMRISSGQQQEIAVQVGNRGQGVLSGAQVRCTATDDSGSLSFVQEASQARNFGSASVSGNTIIFSADGIDLNAGQNTNIGPVVRVDEGTSNTTAGTVQCDLLVDGSVQGSASTSVFVP